MIDRTLIFLFQKLLYYKKIDFDQKNNYFINIQIINTPNCKIIKYISGF